SPAWLSSRLRSIMKQAQSANLFMTGTIFASTELRPTTVKQRNPNESTFRDVRNHSTGTSFGSGSRDHRFLLCFGAGDWVLSETIRQHRRRFFPGRPGDDRMGRRLGIRLGEPWVP